MHHNINTRQKDIWKPATGEKLHAEQEFDNAVDKFAMKVVKNNKTVGHLSCEYSQILWYFITHDITANSCVGQLCLVIRVK